MIPFDSQEAKDLNIKIFRDLREKADNASRMLAKIKGPCPDAKEAGIDERFTHKLAIAPTASISIIAGNSSPGIEPYVANAYTQKTLAGSMAIKNKFLKEVLAKHHMDTDTIWSSIVVNNGSVQHLSFLTEHERNVFRTAYEINQKAIIEMAADRTHYICQAQSLNLFLYANIHKKDLHELHLMTWKLGVKSLYYCRSMSIQRAETVSNSDLNKVNLNNNQLNNQNNAICTDDICTSCQ